MELLTRLKCTTKGNFQEYYEKLSTEELKERIHKIHQSYFVPIFAWLIAMFIIAFSTDMDPALMFVFFASFSSTILALYEDLRRRKKTIRKILDQRK